MILLSPQLQAALAATVNEPIDLYELYLDSGTVFLADQAIAWGGHQYEAGVKDRSAIKRFADGEFDRVTITLANVDLSAAQLLLTNETEGRRLIVRRIDRSVPSDSLVLFNGVMERVSNIGDETCEIEAVQLIGSIDHEVPSRLFSLFCPFPFKGAECRYAGAGQTCDKSWSQCSSYGNTASFGGFRFVPHAGSYQYKETTSSRAWYSLGLLSRKKTRTVTGTFDAVDDTPYDVPIPLVYGRVQMSGIVIQHEDTGAETKVLAAFCAGPLETIFHLRANQVGVADWTPHVGQFGGTESQIVDARFPHSYEYNLLGYAGLTIPSDVRAVDPAPEILAVISGRKVDQYAQDGSFATYAWTDNPVWCVRDFMTLPLAQGGMGIPYDLVDEVMAAQTAAYCDEQILDTTNDQKIYNPATVPAAIEYKRYRSTSVIGQDETVDGPYDDFAPGEDDDTDRAPVPVPVKRFTLNVAIAKSEKAVDVLFRKLLPAFRGYLTWSKDGKIQIRCERPVPHTTLAAGSAIGAASLACTSAAQLAAGDLVLASPLTAAAECVTVQSVSAGSLQLAGAATKAHAAGDEVLRVAMAFDDGNMLGSVEYPLSDRQTSVNRVTIKYVDAPAGFEGRELQINDFEHQAKVHRVDTEDLDGSAIDSYFQAWRIGQWRRAKLRDLGKFIAIKADIRASVLEVGDVIAVSAIEAGLLAVPFRVIELSYEENDEVSIVGQLYSTEVYSDTAPQTTVNVPAIFERPAAPGVPVPPNSLTSAGWSMSIAEEGASLTGEPRVRLRITVTERPAMTTMFTAWLYRGATAPADVSAFHAENNTPISASGSTYLDLWLDQEDSPYTLQIGVVPSGSGYETPTASTVVKAIAIPAGVVETAAPPSAPTSPSVSVIDNGETFGLRVAWIPPNPVGSTVGYNFEARYYSDAGATAPISTWIPLDANILGASTSTMDFGGSWAKQSYDSWVKVRVRGINRNSETSAWVESTGTAPKLNKTTLIGVITPPALGSDGWDIISPVRTFDVSRAGLPQACIEIVVTARPANATMFTAWVCKGSGVHPYTEFHNENTTAISVSGQTYMYLWVDQDKVGYDYQIAIVPSNNGVTALTASAVMKGIVIPPIAATAPVGSFSVTIESATNAGIPQCRHTYHYAPPADLQYFLTNVSRQRTDINYIPLESDWHLVESVAVARTTDWINRPPAAEYWQYKAETVTFSGVVSTPQYCYVTIPASTGIIANLSQATGIVPMEALLIQGSDNAMSNPGFEANGGSGIGWHQWGDGGEWTFPIGNYRSGKCCAAHIGHTGSQALANSAGYKVAIGDQLTMSVYLVGEAGYNGTATIYLYCAGNSGEYITSICVASVAGGASDWVRLSASATVPVGVAVVVPVLQLDGHTTAARWFADDFSLVRQIGGSQVRDDAFGHGVTKSGDKFTTTTDNTANLLSNPGFEYDRKDWSAFQSDVKVITSSGSYSGSKCLELVPGQQGVWTKTPIVVKAGETYKAETWVACSGGSTGQTAIALRIVSSYDEAIGPHVGSGVIADEWTYIIPTASWKKHTVYVTAPASGYLWVFLWGGPTAGIFWIDSVGLYKVIDHDLIKSLDWGKFDPTTVSGNEFEVGPDGKIRFKSVPVNKVTGFDLTQFSNVPGDVCKLINVDADVIKTGILWVGNGKVAKIGVFSGPTPSEANLIVWMGQEKVNSVVVWEGLFAKRFAFGGTSYLNSPLKSDAAGNVSITDAEFLFNIVGTIMQSDGTMPTSTVSINKSALYGGNTGIAIFNNWLSANKQYLSLKASGISQYRTLDDPYGLVQTLSTWACIDAKFSQAAPGTALVTWAYLDLQSIGKRLNGTAYMSGRTEFQNGSYMRLQALNENGLLRGSISLDAATGAINASGDVYCYNLRTGEVIATASVSGPSFKVGGWQIIGARQPAITDPGQNGLVRDDQCRATVTLILQTMRNHGLISAA